MHYYALDLLIFEKSVGFSGVCGVFCKVTHPDYHFDLT